MLETIIKALKKGLSTQGGAPMSEEAKRLAAAALLVEAARRDDDFADAEKAAIKSILSRHFQLNDADATALLELAVSRQKIGMGEWIFTKAISDGFSLDERRNVVTMLWEVALSDGRVHKLEATMIHQLGKEIGLSPADVEAAQTTAKA